MKKAIPLSAICSAVILGLMAPNANAATQQDIYAPQLFSGGGYGQSNNSYGGGGAWVPLYQNPTNLVFTQFTMPEFRKQTGFYESIDLGVRHLVPGRSLWGVFGGVSSIQGQTYNYDFYRAVGGFEFQLPHWIFNFTADIPFGDSNFVPGVIDTSESLVDDPNSSQGYKNILVDQEADRINNLPGGIAELGLRVPHSRGLTIYGGYYAYFGKNGSPNYEGPEFRLQYQLGTLLGWHANWLHHVDLDAGWSDDRTNSSVYTVGISVDIPVFGDSQYHNLTALQQAMEAPVTMPAVDRGINNKRGSGETYDMTDGQRTTVQEVSTKAELESATSSSDHANWVLMTSNITNMGTDTLDLANGVNLTGNGITLDDGTTFLANGSGNNKTLEGSWSGSAQGDDPAIRVASDGSNRIQYLTISNSGGSNVNYNAIANTFSGSSGLSVGTVNINHVTSSGGFSFVVDDDKTTSNISIDNNTVTLGSNYTADGGIYFESTADSLITLASLSSNTVSTSTNGIAAVDINANSGNITVSGNINNNTVTINGASASTRGIELQALNSGGDLTVNSNANISNNNITATNSGTGAGLYFFTSAGGQATIRGDITGNTISTQITTFARGAFEFVSSSSTSLLTITGDVANNNLTNTGAGAAFAALSLSSGNINVTGGITGNTFTSTEGAGMYNRNVSGTGSITFNGGIGVGGANTFVYNANTDFGIQNTVGSGTLSASNSGSITSDNTFSPSAGSGNQIDNAFS